MPQTRRTFLLQAGVAFGAGAAAAGQNDPAGAPLPIVDTHQHLWDLRVFRLPWLQSASEVLRRDYGLTEYREATRGLEIRHTVYIEVDVAADQKLAEARHVVQTARGKGVTPMAAVVGGDPASPGFENYVREIRALGSVIKGVRQVLHNPAMKQGYCLRDDFVRG